MIFIEPCFICGGIHINILNRKDIYYARCYWCGNTAISCCQNEEDAYKYWNECNEKPLN